MRCTNSVIKYHVCYIKSLFYLFIRMTRRKYCQFSCVSYNILISFFINRYIELNFSGTYVETSSDCTLYHICENSTVLGLNQKLSTYLCPPGTRYHIASLKCVWWWVGTSNYNLFGCTFYLTHILNKVLRSVIVLAT